MERVKNERGIDLTTDDSILTRKIHEASAWFAERADRVFVPYVPGNLLLDATNGRTLSFDSEDVLAVTGITNGDATVVASTQYVLRPNNAYPKTEAEMLASNGLLWTWATDQQQAISLQGTLGYHENWLKAFKSVATITGSLNASSTLVSVSDTSVYETLSYVRAEGELMQVTGTLVAGAPGTLTVERAVQGTAAATHNPTIPLEAYQQNPLVLDAVNLLALHFFDYRDGYAAQLLDTSKTIADIPSRVEEIVSRFQRRVFSI